ncbi:uncharacterized protein [Ambystoma mexicanum]|uniref:uncharacterized protein isoform X2 n=1 Tax=Ambystoma mexicanum TaxID=8296 RepID=UPI0037E937F3
MKLPQAQSLQCYTCSSASDTASCNTVTNCTTGQDAYCKKVTQDPYSAFFGDFSRFWVGNSTSVRAGRSLFKYPHQQGFIRATNSQPDKPSTVVSSSVSKSCEAACEESTCINGARDVQTSVYCCSTDLCNGVTSVRISSALLSLAAAISGFLLKAGS